MADNVISFVEKAALYRGDVEEGVIYQDEPISLYDMEINDVGYYVGAIFMEVMRVPGGWVYTRFLGDDEIGYSQSSTFVPYIEEEAS